MVRPWNELVKKENEFVWEDKVHGECLEKVKYKYIDMTEFVPICQATLLEIKTATETDAEFGLLTAVIKQGWPETKGVLSPSIQDYFPFREELTAQNGIMFKGGRINVVPHCLRKCIIDKVHASHLGIQACLGRAKEAFYWLRFYKQISEFISNCTICNSYKPTQ